MGFFDNLLCKETLERNASLEKSNQALLREVEELKKIIADKSSHLEQINVYKKTVDEYRIATANMKKRLEQEQQAFENDVRDYEASRKEKSDDIVRLKTIIEKLEAELSVTNYNIEQSNIIIQTGKTDVAKLRETITDLSAQIESLNTSIVSSRETEAKCKKEERELLSNLESLEKKQSQTELAFKAMNESLSHLKADHANEIVFDLLEMDCKAGYVSEWAPQLFKRLYRHNKDRAKRLYLELWARHPEPEKFVFSVDSLKLTVDGKPIEEFFAAIIAERTGQLKENPEPFIRAWENFVNASNN